MTKRPKTDPIRTSALRKQMDASARLDKVIWANLEDIGYGE